MHKRFTTVPIAVLTVAAVGLTGCSSSSKPKSGGSSSTGGSTSSGGSSSSGGAKVTLSLESFSGDPTLPPLIKEFEAQNPGVTVKYTGLPYPQILTQINTQLVSHNAGDIVSVFPGEGNPIAVQTLAKNNYLADLTSQSWTSGLNTAQKQVAGTGGKIYLAANNSTIIPAIYNKQALASVGATPPKTWTQVLSLCSTAKAKGKVAYALGGLAASDIQFYVYALVSTLVYGPNPTFAADQAAGKTSFTKSQWGTALTKLGDMQKAGCFSKSPNGVSLDTAQGQVAQGQALGIVTVSNQIATIQGKAAKGTTLETAPFPATDDASATFLPVGMGAGYGVNARSKHLAEANKFVEFFMSKAGIESAITSGSIFPSVPVGAFKHNAALDGVLAQAASTKTTGFPDAGWPNSNVQQVLGTNMQKILGGNGSVSSALSALDSAYKGS